MVQNGSKPTPEKQLLKLIEEPKAEVIAKETIKRKSFSLFSFGAFKGRIAFFKDSFKGGFKFDGAALSLDLKFINRILGAGAVVLIGYFIMTLVKSELLLKKLPDLTFEYQPSAGGSSLPEASMSKTLSYYLEKITSRNVFRVSTDTVVKTTEEKKGPSSAIVEATKDFSLVGISWSDDPDAMIEDTKSQRTYFVKRGQLIGEIKVEAIYRDKVLLSYKGEELEIK